MSHLHPVHATDQLTAIEFFAGIGLARAGMADAGISTVWANDYDKNKFAMYSGQWGDDDFALENVFDVDPDQVPAADIAWSSSPCTDLSLAGKRDGISGRESSAFFGFTNVLRGMGDRRPNVAVLENVVGLASSHGGDDLRAAIREFNELGYAVDVVTIDARRFVPQSRPRLFLIGAKQPLDGGKDDTALRPDSVAWVHQEDDLRTFKFPFPAIAAPRKDGFSSEIEHLADDDPRWWDSQHTEAFISSMSPTQRLRADGFINARAMTARTAYRRTRNGVPTWEMRAEDIAGCLRTARGGSSKQAVAVMGHGQIRVRWMTGLEYARLMGAGWYNLSGLRESQVHYGFGDAVAVPVVSWLSREALAPLALPRWQTSEASQPQP
ncbi:DNA cytosine methyltransferase [Corynebacterium imitans]|uniref:DNA cytosine methyltransferase n=1 Tax=Corynebacterium imitans TaxID=156978 RepID=UPI00254EA3A0|nr:DNA cytosine methyltransferase [Corynebacterium imitans]MDK8305645.1 DNA cytosine methyltransferase [Corynebacterium imitans]MDK8636489.1 DNA cytosine methyltransferase [Corynebacterium imitans]MDK8771837.1 DNA cytosine methyltransferase [Corynebacterium imitans]